MDAQIVTYLISLATIVVTPLAGFATKLLIQKGQLAAMNVKGVKMDALKLNISAATAAAEQKFKAGMIRDRKQDAVKTVQALNKNQGINVTDDIISTLIEASVWNDISTPTPVVSPLPIPSPVINPVPKPDNIMVSGSSLPPAAG